MTRTRLTNADRERGEQSIPGLRELLPRHERGAAVPVPVTSTYETW